jgi:Tol biopolymer transport system component
LIALAALAAGIAAGVLFPRRPSIDLGTYRFTPFAVDPGVNSLPTWSPDGRSLAYVSGSTLLVRTVDADSPTTVARDIEGSIESIFWFPDGARLGYLSPTVNPNFLAWSPDGRRLAYSGWPGNASVWIMPVGSDGVGPAGRAFPNHVWLSPPGIAWMPDNRSLVLTEGLVSKRPGLWIGNADTGAITKITAGVESVDNPSVSPDGRRIAYSSASWNFDLVALSLDDLSAVDVLTTTRQEFGGVYADGESIVYITDRSGEEEIRIRRLADGTERVIAGPRNVPITPPAFASVFPSPDATRILFTCWDGKGMTAWVAPMGGPPVRIGGAAEIWGATWSPDGREIASVEIDGLQPQLVRRRIGSSEPPVVVKNAKAHAATLPQWSPTGEWIAYRSTDGLAIVRPDGQQRQVLAPDRAPALAWSRDGRTLYAILVAENSNSLQAFDVATGRGRMLRQFAAGSTPAGPVTPSLRLAVSPDGRSLLTSVLRHRSDIWVLER